MGARKKYRELEYPINVIVASEIKKQEDITQDIINGYYKAFDMLSDYHKFVIEKRYKECMTCKEISILRGISSSRISYIERAALISLRKPDKRKYIEYGLEECNKLLEKEIEKDKAFKEYYYSHSDEEIRQDKIYYKSIDDCGFNVRVNNPLKRNRCKKVGDVLELISRHGWYTRIRGLGEFLADSIIQTLIDIEALDEKSTRDTPIVIVKGIERKEENKLC